MLKTHFHSDLVKLSEFLRSVVAIERDMRVRRSKVLPERDEIDAVLAKERLERALKTPVSTEARAGLREELVCKLR